MSEMYTDCSVRSCLERTRTVPVLFCMERALNSFGFSTKES